MGFSNLFHFHVYAFSSIFFSSTYFLHATALERNTTNDAQPPIPGSSSSRVTPFKPGIAIIVGLLTTIFSVTFLALLYMKHCKRGTYEDNSRGNNPSSSSRRNSGINREIIESLPMFKFSSLLGQKDGLECAVCLSVFDPDEVLRLLPKCKHAFHIECVDTWLEAHSTCPLCRYRVDPEDILLVLDCHCYYNNSGVEDHVKSKSEELLSSRKSGRHSHAGEIGSSNSLDIIVENPGNSFHGRASLDSYYSRRVKRPRLFEAWKNDLIRTKSSDSRRASSSALSSRPSSSSSTKRKSNDVENANRRPSTSRRDEHLMVMGHKQQQQPSHRLEHRILISGDDDETPRRRRWSDAHAKELLYLKSEMILGGNGNNESGRKVINQRSVSEIVGMSRFNRSSLDNTSNNDDDNNSINNNNCGERDPNGSIYL